MKKLIILLGAVLLSFSSFAQEWLSNTTTIYNNPLTKSVGIGTTTAVDKLHVIGGIRTYQNGLDAIQPQLYLGNANNTRAFSFQLNSTGSSLNLYTYNGSSWMNKFTFTNGGILGIGNFLTTPQAYLHVKGADHGPGLIVEPGNTTAAYGATIRAKNNFSKSFVVENSISTTYEPFIVYGDGKTKIGPKINANHTDAFLTVDGKVVCKEVYVTDQNWADFVFAADYKLPALKDVEAFYKLNKHLPEIPSAKEVEEKGVSLGEMNKLLLQKIEELTIYLVEQQKEIDLLKKKAAGN